MEQASTSPAASSASEIWARTHRVSPIIAVQHTNATDAATAAAAANRQLAWHILQPAEALGTFQSHQGAFARYTRCGAAIFDLDGEALRRGGGERDNAHRRDVAGGVTDARKGSFSCTAFPCYLLNPATSWWPGCYAGYRTADSGCQQEFRDFSSHTGIRELSAISGRVSCGKPLSLLSLLTGRKLRPDRGGRSTRL